MARKVLTQKKRVGGKYFGSLVQRKHGDHYGSK